MAKPKKHVKKAARKRAVKVTVKAQVEKKDTLRKMPWQPPHDNAPTFRIKVKQKR